MDEDWTGCDSDLHICVEASSWYSFSLAPLLVNHQLKWKILLFDNLKHSHIIFLSPVSLTSKWARPLLSILSCSMLSAQARHSTAIMTPTEKDIRHSSEIYFCGYLFLLTFYWRTKNLCWMLDIWWLLLSTLTAELCQSQSIQSRKHFPLTLDLGELDKYGWAEVPLLVTIREVIFWYSVGGMIYDWSQIFPVCRVFSLTIYPDSLILQTKEFITWS